MHLAGMPIEVWMADCTCLLMTQGFLYLVAIMDWHSRLWRVDACTSQA